MSSPEIAPFVETRRLSKSFSGPRGRARLAVDAVDLAVRPGEVLGLVGESGSGKSTLGRLMIGLTAPSDGEIRVDGRPLATLTSRERHALHRRFQIVFQNPAGALSPKRTVAETLTEPLLVQRIGRRADWPETVARALSEVGLAEEHAARYPHELSGGQRQRVSMARALILKPDFIVADEPVSALDVSIQAQVLNLFRDLRAGSRLAMLFISHDLAVVNYLADRVAVMQAGRVVETGTREAVIFSPRHPYTSQLLAAGAAMGSGTAGEAAPDTLPTASMPTAAGQGCAHAGHCPLVAQVCRERPPVLIADGETHAVACHART